MGFFANLFDDNAKDIKKYSKSSGGDQCSGAGQWQRFQRCRSWQAKTDEFRRPHRRRGNLQPRDLLAGSIRCGDEKLLARVLEMRHFDVQLIGGMVLHPMDASPR